VRGAALAGFEVRAAALLRRRLSALAVLAALSLAVAAAVLLLSGDEGRAATPLLFAAFLPPLVLAHGMVSGDLRSGVALLWLQKPVGPVRFYLGRWLDVTATVALVSLALIGVGAALAGLVLDGAAARRVFELTPILLLWGVLVCSGVFGFSAWGTSLDSTCLLVLLIVSGVTGLMAPDLLGRIHWLALPLDEMMAFGRDSRGDPLRALARRESVAFLRFVVVWVGVGSLGAAVTTRHPFPREASR
jgi:hypothetical protein